MGDPFDLQSLFSQAEVQERVAAYLRTGDTYPIHIDWDITTNCEYRCAHCGDLARHGLNHGGPGIETLLSLVEEMQSLGVRDVSLIGGGEPTSSPHLVAVAKALKAAGIRVGVVSNGSRIDGPMAAGIAAHCDWVRVSLDAASPEMYESLHRPPAGVTLSKVMENVGRLARLMPGRVGVSYLVLVKNVMEMAAAAGAARRCGCAYIRFRPAQHPLTGAFLPIRDKEGLARQLQQCMAQDTDGFSVSVAETLVEEDRPDCGDVRQEKRYRRCHAQAFGTVIAGTGSVYVCSKWRGDGESELGNVTTARLADIWNGARRRSVVSRLDPQCKCASVFCQAHAYNAVLEELAGRP